MRSFRITVNADNCKDEVEKSIGIVTALCPYIGYAEAARIAKRALREGRSVRSLVTEENIMSAARLDDLLDPAKMI